MSSCDLGSAAVATKPRSVSQIVGDLRIHWDGSGGDLGMQCTGVKRCVPTADGSEIWLPTSWGEGSLSHDLSIGFHPRWFSRRISEASTVCPSKSCSFDVYAWVCVSIVKICQEMTGCFLEASKPMVTWCKANGRMVSSSVVPTPTWWTVKPQP